MNYASNYFEASTSPTGNPWIRSNFSPRAKIVFQYPTQVLCLMVDFFLKGKMSDLDILYICQAL